MGVEKKISFITIKRVYEVLLGLDCHQFQSPRASMFRGTLRSHLINGIWAFCSVTTGVYERSSEVFSNPAVDMAVSESSSVSPITKALYVLYSNIVVMNRQEKQDVVAKAILGSGFNVYRACDLASVIITESLMDQINMTPPNSVDVLASYTCNCILINLSDKRITPYMIADSTNEMLVQSVFAVSCLFATFIPAKVKKVKMGELTTEGVLTRSGIKYSMGKEMMHMSRGSSKIHKYRSREMYPEMWGFFVGIFQNERFTVHHKSSCPTNLTIPTIEAVEVQHEEVGLSGRVKVDGIPFRAPTMDSVDLVESSSTSTAQQEPGKDYAEPGMCFSFYIAIINFFCYMLRGCCMGTNFSKTKKPTFWSEPDPDGDKSVQPSSIARRGDEGPSAPKKKDLPPDDLEISFVDIDEKFGKGCSPPSPRKR